MTQTRSRFILRVDWAGYSAIRTRLLRLEIEHGNAATIALMRELGVRLPLPPHAMSIELVAQDEKPNFLILEPVEPEAMGEG